MRRILLFSLLVATVYGCSRSRTPDDYEVWGIDVSKHQTGVDWRRVVERNRPHFVFLKATEGLIISDPTYARHACQLDSLGVLWGAYHFFGHRTGGREQARNFIRTAQLKPGNLLPVLDIEKHRFMTDPKKTVKEAKAFCDEIRGYYGADPIIYCSTVFYETYLKKDFPAKRYTLWIADYRGEPGDLEWHFWQHTDAHRLEGIRGNVDRNVFGHKPEHLKRLTL
ncbi:glycoside hydrolase family 25 protein [Desulfobulbus sp.]|uniref:glycoside hydrolase family 25 protein n=1 Tax=Desulfobulbus sp. TaxID=895 RepID=UPI00286F6551|nr:glycoside hydrolase family 25 protein [Desulfobulbus sp.]